MYTCISSSVPEDFILPYINVHFIIIIIIY